MNPKSEISNPKLDEPPVKPSDTQPRVCPTCGGQVSSRARTCLLCGADLLAPAEESTAPAIAAAPARPRWTLKNILWQIAGAIVGLALLAGIVGGFMTVVRGASHLEPTVTPTVAPIPTGIPIGPTATTTPAPAPTPAASATPIPPRQHTVQAGETLSTIAEKYGTTVEDIQALNNLGSADIIRVGQVLLIPPAGATALPPTPPLPGPTPGTIIYVVQPGETLLGIAQRHGVPLATLQSINNIADPEKLQAGQQLIIPSGPTAVVTTGPALTVTATPPAKYSPPPLLSPLDGATFEGTDMPIVLQWAATMLLRPDEWYLVTIERPGTGRPPATFKTKTTAFYVPLELYPAAQDSQRLFKWRVGIVRQLDDTPTYEDISLPGEIRSFIWLLPVSTPTPTPGPT